MMIVQVSVTTMPFTTTATDRPLGSLSSGVEIAQRDIPSYLQLEESH